MNGFHRVSLKPKVFKREFKNENVVKNAASFTRTAINAPDIIPVKFYYIANDEYVYCSDKTLRKNIGASYLSLQFTSNVPPLVLPVIRNGQKKVMFVSDERAVIDGDAIAGVPYGCSGIYFGGRLFIANGSTLYYSEEFDFTDFSVGLSVGGFVETDAYAGAIVYLFSNDEKLYVICRHAVYTFQPFGKPYEFKLEKIISGLNVAENSACPSEGDLYFISDKNLYRLSGEKIKSLGSALRSFSDFTVENTGENSGLYIARLVTGGTDYVYIYDTRTNKEALQESGSYSVTGKYAKKQTDDRLYLIGIREKTVTESESYSGEYDFGSCAKKSIVRVEAHISGSCRINVVGDGEFSATLTEKCNSVTCFLHGKNFNIFFDNVSLGFMAHKLTVYYVVYGE